MVSIIWLEKHTSSESASAEMSTRIVYIVFEPSGGMRHYAESLSSAMSTIADSILVVPRELEEFSILDSKFMTKLTMNYNPFYYRRLADKIVRQYEPHLVHITSSSIGLMPFITRLRQHEVKVVYTLHDPTPHEYNTTRWGKLVKRYQYLCEMPWILRACNATHVHSVIHRTQLCRKYGDSCVDKIYVAQHGGGAAGTILSGREVPKELHTGNDVFTFLFFGRIEPYKGLPVLLNAFRKVASIDLPCRLVIAGAGSIEKNYHLAPQHCVVINRFIRDSEIRKIFEHSNVVVLPYMSATQTGVIPLAYEFSRPVICSDIGGLPEMVIVGETGLIVPPGDEDALASAMRSLAEDREATRRMGEKARAYMTQQFSWKTVAQQHRAKYATLLTEKEPRRGKTWVTQHNAD